jgi:hypothetical protein
LTDELKEVEQIEAKKSDWSVRLVFSVALLCIFPVTKKGGCNVATHGDGLPDA